MESDDAAGERGVTVKMFRADALALLPEAATDDEELLLESHSQLCACSMTSARTRGQVESILR
jgi:hypothetical protein